MKSYYDILHAMASGGTATLNLNTDKTLGEFHIIKYLQTNNKSKPLKI